MLLPRSGLYGPPRCSRCAAARGCGQAAVERPSHAAVYPLVRLHALRRSACSRFVLPPPLVFRRAGRSSTAGPSPQGSLSAYYYSGFARSSSAGSGRSACSLSSTSFSSFSWESLLSSLAGAAAVVVAVFPTERPGDGVTLTPFQVKFGESAVDRHPLRSCGRRSSRCSSRSSSSSPGTKEAERTGPGRVSTRSAPALILFGAVLAAFAGITGGPD